VREQIRFQRPSLPAAAAIERYLAAAREERWFSNYGPCCRLLRDRLEVATGCAAVPVANATLGLMVAIAALVRSSPRGAGEALVPSFAFAASAQASVWNRLDPVFVDVDPCHWHLAPDELERALQERKGRIAIVIALSSFGTPPPPDVRGAWEDACGRAGVPLLVDSAAGFGAQAADATPVGAQGDAEVVSFHAVKPLAIGEGGAVFSRVVETIEEVKRLSEFGFDRDRRATRRRAINAKLSEPSAAIALAALDGFEEHLRARRQAAADIIDSLPPGFEPQVGHEHGTVQFVPVTAPDAGARNSVLAAARNVVEMRTYYEPLHTMPAFETAERVGDLHVTEDLARRMLSLPMADDLTADEIETIVDTVGAAVPSQTERTR
jgi:dTDP-4-amino-4,6-dideoxygalactose transaminase